MTREIPAPGARAAYLLLHTHRAHGGFITAQFPRLKWLFDYLKEAVNVYRDLRKSHFSFHLADGHSGFVSLAVFCCNCQYFGVFLNADLWVCHRSCISEYILYIRIYQVCWYEAVIQF